MFTLKKQFIPVWCCPIKLQFLRWKTNKANQCCSRAGQTLLRKQQTDLWVSPSRWRGVEVRGRGTEAASDTITSVLRSHVGVQATATNHYGEVRGDSNRHFPFLNFSPSNSISLLLSIFCHPLCNRPACRPSCVLVRDWQLQGLWRDGGGGGGGGYARGGRTS